MRLAAAAGAKVVAHYCFETLDWNLQKYGRDENSIKFFYNFSTFSTFHRSLEEFL